MDRLINITHILCKYNQIYTLEESFKFNKYELLKDLRLSIWLININKDCINEIFNLYDFKIEYNIDLITQIGFSIDSVYISIKNALNFFDKIIKISKESIEEYHLIDNDNHNYPITDELKELLKPNPFNRYYVVKDKKIDYKFTKGICYKKNYYLDQLKPYVENAKLRHIQLQKDYTYTFYFQQFNCSGKINNKDEWDKIMLKNKKIFFPEIKYEENNLHENTTKLYDSSLKYMKKILGNGLHYHAGSNGEIDSPVILDLYKYIGINKNILDIGCGWGGTLNMIRRDLSPDNLVGITNSKKQLDYCYNKLKLKNIYNLDITKHDIPGMFDVILMIESYSHISPYNRKELLKRLIFHTNNLVMRVNCNIEKSEIRVFGDSMIVPTVDELKKDLLDAGWNIYKFEDKRIYGINSVKMWYDNIVKLNLKNPPLHVEVLENYCKRVLSIKDLWIKYHPLIEVIAYKSSYPELYNYIVPKLPEIKYICINDNLLNYPTIVEDIINNNYGQHPLIKYAKGLFLTFNVSEVNKIYDILGKNISSLIKQVCHLFSLGSKIIFSIAIIDPTNQDYTLKPHYDTYYTPTEKTTNEYPIFNSITYLSGCNYDNGSLIVYDNNNDKEYLINPKPGRTCVLIGKVKHAVKGHSKYIRIASQVALFL
jgi:hypothetical protein